MLLIPKIEKMHVNTQKAQLPQAHYEGPRTYLSWQVESEYIKTQQ